MRAEELGGLEVLQIGRGDDLLPKHSVQQGGKKERESHPGLTGSRCRP